VFQTSFANQISKNQNKMSADLEKVVILGAGSFGTAIGSIFARIGHPVVILDRNEVTITLSARMHTEKRCSHILIAIVQDRCKCINETHQNPTYVKDFVLPDTLTATTDPEVAFKGLKNSVTVARFLSHDVFCFVLLECQIPQMLHWCFTPSQFNRHWNISPN
jgi:hypothetical protein